MQLIYINLCLQYIIELILNGIILCCNKHILNVIKWQFRVMHVSNSTKCASFSIRGERNGNLLIKHTMYNVHVWLYLSNVILPYMYISYLNTHLYQYCKQTVFDVCTKKCICTKTSPLWLKTVLKVNLMVIVDIFSNLWLYEAS